MGVTPEEVQDWAAGFDHSRLEASLQARSSAGDPRAKFALAKNEAEALAAMEQHATNETFIHTGQHTTAHCGRDSASLIALTVCEYGGAIQVGGVSKSLRKQNIGHRSFTLGMTRDDAIALAQAILAKTGEDDANS
jgi:hypothetical protein